MIGSLTASVIVLAGCNSEVGTAPSGKQATSDYLAKELEKGSTTKSGKPAPKSIKSKLLIKPAEENK